MHRRTRPAFTLIEILIVVVIMGIAGALVVPSMLSAGTLGLQGAARLIVADIQYAQNEAIARGANRSLVFDPLTDRYRITDEAGATLDLNWMRTGGQPDAPGLQDGHTVDFQNDSRFEGIDLAAVNFGVDASVGKIDPLEVRFDALGAPVGSTQNGKIRLSNADHTLTIEVDGFTGRVTVR